MDDAIWTDVLLSCVNGSNIRLARSERRPPIFLACKEDTQYYPDSHQAGNRFDIFQLRATSSSGASAFAFFDIGSEDHELLVWISMIPNASVLGARVSHKLSIAYAMDIAGTCRSAWYPTPPHTMPPCSRNLPPM
jgi:hypothetical protein